MHAWFIHLCCLCRAATSSELFLPAFEMSTSELSPKDFYFTGTEPNICRLYIQPFSVNPADCTQLFKAVWLRSNNLPPCVLQFRMKSDLSDNAHTWSKHLLRKQVKINTPLCYNCYFSSLECYNRWCNVLVTWQNACSLIKINTFWLI